MCEFISWIEKNKDIIFLTGDDVFRTKEGKKLQKYCGNNEDLVGHGAIRRFYNIPHNVGVNIECSNFLSPRNFPKEIVKAIKSGKMRGLGTPDGLLLKKANPLLPVYSPDIKRRLARIKKNKEANYLPTNNIESMFHWGATKEGHDFWSKICRQIESKKEKPTTQNKFWNAFKIKKNRRRAWR